MQKQLRKSEIKELNEKLKRFEIELGKKDNVVQKDNVLIVNNKAEYFIFEEQVIPLLKNSMNTHLKKIVVDMGAIKFVTSGADIMRPGITDIDEDILKGEAIAITDETHGKVIAIGQALFSGKELKEMANGKVIKNLHYPGDELWKY
jgi:PUA-domain protein